LAGTSGDYNVKTGYSTQLFALFELTPDEFEAIVRDNPTDEAVLQALLARKPLTQEEIDAWNEPSIARRPAGQAPRARHRKQLEDAGQGHRDDVRTMYDRLDLEDGREVPIRG